MERRHRPPGQERRLRARPQDQPSVVVQPAHRPMRLQRRMLHPSRPECRLIDLVRRRESRLDVTQRGMQLPHHVPVLFVPVHQRRVPGQRRLGVEHGRQDLVLDVQQPAGLLGGRLTGRDDRRHPLADEADHVVEHPGVRRVLGHVLVLGGGEEPVRRVLVRQDQLHARHPQSGRGLHGDDPGMRVRRSQHLEMQHPGHVEVEGVPRGPGDDLRTGRGAERRADRGAGRADVARPGDGVTDRAVPGAPAQVALQRTGQVLALLRGERGGRHDQTRRTESALESLGVQERLLRRVQLAAGGSQALDRGHRPPLSAERRVDARVHGLAVDVHRARAAVPGVAALLDPEAALLAQVGPQALTGPRRALVGRSVDLHAHALSSVLICSA